MSFHQMTKIVGLNIADHAGLDAVRAFRAARGVVGILIVALGLYLIVTQGTCGLGCGSVHCGKPLQASGCRVFGHCRCGHRPWWHGFAGHEEN